LVFTFEFWTTFHRFSSLLFRVANVYMLLSPCRAEPSQTKLMVLTAAWLGLNHG
jgi:hypothetical protein